MSNPQKHHVVLHSRLPLTLRTMLANSRKPLLRVIQGLLAWCDLLINKETVWYCDIVVYDNRFMKLFCFVVTLFHFVCITRLFVLTFRLVFPFFLYILHRFIWFFSFITDIFPSSSLQAHTYFTYYRNFRQFCLRSLCTKVLNICWCSEKKYSWDIFMNMRSWQGSQKKNIHQKKIYPSYILWLLYVVWLSEIASISLFIISLLVYTIIYYMYTFLVDLYSIQWMIAISFKWN